VSARPSAPLERVAPAERYVDARELAATLAVSTRTVGRWVADGCPSETWGMGHTRRFLISAVVAWAKRREPTRTMARPRGDACDVPDLRHRQARAKE
jgi:hypothetical protein